jgi:hypothetical protein
MRCRLPGWVLLIYLAIDLTNPYVPGAFEFTPDGGLAWVEAMAHARPRLSIGATEASTPALAPAPRLLLAEDVSSRSAEPGGRRDLMAWLVSVRTADPPARDLPPPSSDDH